MDEDEARRMVESGIRTIPDYPKPGIIFRDITPMLQDARIFRTCIDALSGMVRGLEFDYIVGIDARGFIIGSALAYLMGVGFIPARKKGKLPYKALSVEYKLEYGTASLEMHEDSPVGGRKVLVVDDLLATGGTAGAAGELVRRLGGTVAAYAFVIELSDLGGRKMLGGAQVASLIKFSGD